MSLNGVLELNAKLENALELFRATQSKHEGGLSKFNTHVRPVRAQYKPPSKIHSNPKHAALRGRELDDEDLLETEREEEVEELDVRELEDPTELELELRELEELVELRDDDPVDPADPWEEREEEELGQKTGSGVHSNVCAFH